MKKAPEAFRTISEVAEILETPAHVLRFWESKFYQIRPVKRAGGRRYYRPDDVALINGIKSLLQDRGMTIRGVQRVLQEQGVKHVAGLGAPLLAPVDDADLLEDGDLVEGSVAFEEALDRPTDDDAAQTPDRAAIPAPATLKVDLPEEAEPLLAAEEDSAPFAEAPAEPPLESPAAFDEPDEDGPPPLDEAFQPLAEGEDPALPLAGTLLEGDEDPTEMLDTEPATTPDIAPDTLAARPDPETAETNAADLAAAQAAARRALAAEAAARDEAQAEPREPSERAQLARRLRSMPRGALGPRRDRAELLSRRIDALLERMSEASGAGRW